MRIGHPPLLWALSLMGLFSCAACSGSNAVSPGPVSPGGVLPPGAKPYTLAGVIGDSETGAAIAGAKVFSQVSSTFTGPDGSYTLAVADSQFPSATKEGFEYRMDDGGCCLDHTWNTTLQAIIRIAAGQTVTATVFPDEGSGTLWEDDCEPCKRIRLTIPRSGTLWVRLTADDPEGGLQVSICTPRGCQIARSVAVRAGEEAQVLVWRRFEQGFTSRLRFELRTSLDEPN